MLFSSVLPHALAPLATLLGATTTISSSVPSKSQPDYTTTNATCSLFESAQNTIVQGVPEMCLENHKHALHSTPSEAPAYPQWMPNSCSKNSSTQLCAYTSSNFANNRGLSILTKPHIANQVAAYSSVASPSTKDPRVAYPPPFKVKQIPGKGLGVVANRTIERGERLFGHSLIGIFHDEAFEEPGLSEYTSLFHNAVDHLPNDTNVKFWGLAAHETGVDGVVGRLNTNTFFASIGGEGHKVVVPETARMNHDCRPNTMYHLDEDSLVHYTHATRTIYAGEEITITYIDPIQNYEARQAAIERSWGFKCVCSHCTMPKRIREESDIRTHLILELSKEFENIESGEVQIDDMVAKAELLVSLHEQERLWGSMDEAYRIAALSHAKAGSAWSAVKWTMKATEASLINSGKRDRVVNDLKLMGEKLKSLN